MWYRCFLGDCRVCNSLVCAGPALRHILRTVPSEAPRRADAVPLLAQPEAPRSHQRVPGSAVHRSASYPSVGCWTEWMWFLSVYPPPPLLSLQPGTPSTVNTSSATMPSTNLRSRWKLSLKSLQEMYFILWTTMLLLVVFFFYYRLYSCGTFCYTKYIVVIILF